MIKEEDYLKAKQMVQEYEKQLNISDVSGSLITLIASARNNFEVWRDGEMDDTKFGQEFNRNLLRIEKKLGLIERL
jgi:hypothetical protein